MHQSINVASCVASLSLGLALLGGCATSADQPTTPPTPQPVPVAAPTASPTPAPTPVPTPTPIPVVSPNRLLFAQIRFDQWPDGTNDPGRCVIDLINHTGATINDINSYQLVYAPANGGPIATASINQPPFQVSSLFAGESIRLASPFGLTYNDLSWQNSGGALGLFHGAATSSAEMVDFVQWGATTSLEATAIRAGLWAPGTTLPTVAFGLFHDPMATASVLTLGATGSVNWWIDS